MIRKTEQELIAHATDEQFKAICMAADLEGIDLSELVRRGAVEEAHRVIERYKVIKVSMETSEKMMAALDEKANPGRLYEWNIPTNQTLRWLAENVSDWERPDRNLINLVNGKVVYPRTTYFCGYPFTYEQWLQARKDLGLSNNGNESD